MSVSFFPVAAPSGYASDREVSFRWSGSHWLPVGAGHRPHPSSAGADGTSSGLEITAAAEEGPEPHASTIVVVNSSREMRRILSTGHPRRPRWPGLPLQDKELGLRRRRRPQVR